MKFPRPRIVTENLVFGSQQVPSATISNSAVATPLRVATGNSNVAAPPGGTVDSMNVAGRFRDSHPRCQRAEAESRGAAVPTRTQSVAVHDRSLWLRTEIDTIAVDFEALTVPDRIVAAH